MTYKAYIVESERGFGSKVEDIREFDTEEERNSFIEEYNRKYNPGMYDGSSAPDWYMAARTFP